MTIRENYPKPVYDCLMTSLSTHDTVRILSELGSTVPRKLQGGYRMSAEERSAALTRLRLAALLQFTLPGIPCIYYGDEIGMEGAADPYCRAFFEWENAQGELREYYRTLGQMRARYRENHKQTFAGYPPTFQRRKSTLCH